MRTVGLVSSQGRIRRSAIFMLLALVAETLSMYWRHPLSFYFFLIAGGVFALLGTIAFLLSFVSPQVESETWAPLASVERPRRAKHG